MRINKGKGISASALAQVRGVLPMVKNAVFKSLTKIRPMKPTKAKEKAMGSE